MTHIAIKCRNIKKHYGEGEVRVEALRGVDLDVEQGELTLLVGPSGSGKTTLLSIITTILTPDEGQLFLLDQEVSKMSADEKAHFCLHNLGVVFQSLVLIPTLTVAENVSLPLLVAGCPPIEAYRKSIALLRLMQIGSKAQFSPDQLSKGQQQRVAIARAMINDSKIIVCDEPTSALDHVAGNEIMALLKELAINYTKTILVVTHDHRIFSFADRIVYMSDGRITPGE
jgi:putative ABC transport system ATP-binding protein